MTPKIKTYCLVLGFLAVLVFGKPSAAERGAAPSFTPIVAAVTTDGRTVTGVVDARTNNHALWLRRDTANTSLAVPVAWEEVREATLNSKPVDLGKLRDEARGIATHRTVTEVWSTDTFIDTGSVPPVRHPSGPVRSSRRVASLRVSARAENWDADAADDGLLVFVTPLDESGRPVRLRGELRVRLFGSKQTTRHTQSFRQLTQWSTEVREADFQEGFATYRVPFRSFEPQVDTDVGALGRVEARLGVYGGGAFEATAPVRLRAFDPLGDALQQETGSRHFRGQRHARQRRSVPTGDGLFFSAPVGP